MDTNVLVSALRSRKGVAFSVLEAMRARRFEFVLSVPLFLEYEDVLKRPGLVPVPEAGVDVLLRLLAAQGVAQRIFFLWRPFLRDAKDDMVLEVAVAGRCQAIVTYNPRDFAGVEKFGLHVWSPFQLLDALETETTRSLPENLGDEEGESPCQL